MRHPYGETVIIHPMTLDGTDDYGNPAPSFGDDIERDHCAVEPRTEVEEVGNNRSMVVNGFHIYDTLDVPVGPHDELTVRGVRCVVDGEIARWANPFSGDAPGAVITVKRVEG